MSVFSDYKPIGSLAPEPDVYTHDPQPLSEESVEEEKETRPLQPFIGLFILLIVFLIGRLLTLQVAQGSRNLYLAEGNRIRVRTTPSPRGVIFDRFNTPLVKNIVRYDLSLIPADLPSKKEDRQAVLRTLKEKIPTINDDQLGEIQKKGVYSLEPIVLEENIGQEKAIKYQIDLADLPGISIQTQPVRSYPDGQGLGHILGYIGKISGDELKNASNYALADYIGKSGIEKVYEKDIKGIDGQEQIEIDAKGHLQRIIATTPASQGKNVILNLDLKLQQATYNALSEQIKKANVSKGSAVAMNPTTGEIYALVSIPDYNPNDFLNGDKGAVSKLFKDPNQPLLNRAISGNYPSGSTIKPIYAASALQEKIIAPSFVVDTPSEIKIGEASFPDWKDHGPTDIRRAIAESNNIFFYGLAGGWDKIKGLGIKKMDDYLKLFGFGSATGIDLPSEGEGFVPTPEWKKAKKKEPWYIGDTYHLGIGQGDFLVTPLQMTTSMASVINGGKLVTPHLLSKVETIDNKELKKVAPEYRKEGIIDNNNFQIVRDGMRQTVESGSARNIADATWANGSPLPVAGKTGTAQSGHGESLHGWFSGYAPYDNPKMIVTVLIEDGGEGHDVAVPVAKEMFKTFFRDDNPAAK